MQAKSFSSSVPFRVIPGTNPAISIPVVTSILIASNGTRYTLPLLFDTGASVTTLRKDLYPLLGVTAWDVGTPVQTYTAGGKNPVLVYAYRAQFEIFGKTIDSAVHLTDIATTPFYMGLLGRENIFEQFGFGFWESTNELLVTPSP